MGNIITKSVSNFQSNVGTVETTEVVRVDYYYRFLFIYLFIFTNK